MKKLVALLLLLAPVAIADQFNDKQFATKQFATKHFPTADAPPPASGSVTKRRLGLGLGVNR